MLVAMPKPRQWTDQVELVKDLKGCGWGLRSSKPPPTGWPRIIRVIVGAKTLRAFHHMPKEPSRVFREWALEALCGRSGYLGSCYPSRTALTTTDGSISSPRIFEATGNARWVAKSHSGLRSSCRIC